MSTLFTDTTLILSVRQQKKLIKKGRPQANGADGEAEEHPQLQPRAQTRLGHHKIHIEYARARG